MAGEERERTTGLYTTVVGGVSTACKRNEAGPYVDINIQSVQTQLIEQSYSTYILISHIFLLDILVLKHNSDVDLQYWIYTYSEHVLYTQ